MSNVTSIDIGRVGSGDRLTMFFSGTMGPTKRSGMGREVRPSPSEDPICAPTMPHPQVNDTRCDSLNIHYVESAAVALRMSASWWRSPAQRSAR